MQFAARPVSTSTWTAAQWWLGKGAPPRAPGRRRLLDAARRVWSRSERRGRAPLRGQVGDARAAHRRDAEVAPEGRAVAAAAQQLRAGAPRVRHRRVQLRHRRRLRLAAQQQRAHGPAERLAAAEACRARPAYSLPAQLARQLLHQQPPRQSVQHTRVSAAPPPRAASAAVAVRFRA